jgi:hypothetical protein
LEHSGLLCADLDELGEQLPEIRKKLMSSPYVWAVFLSPSGDGLKAVFRAPADACKHVSSFSAVEKHVRELTDARIDESCKDVARLCFLSYDPETYHNPSATEIEPLPEPGEPKASFTANGAPDLSARQRIATELLGEIEWQSDTSGFVSCPGQPFHTSVNGERDCKIDLDNVPTVHCFHNSCRGILDGVNHELRSRIGKAECDNGATNINNTDAEAIAALAALPLLEYERQRELQADKLGCRVATLDKLVEAKRPAKTDSALQGSAVICPDVEPWPEAVDGAAVLNDVAETFKRYVVLPDGAKDALALWSAGTHCFNAFPIYPRLNVTSPERGCGKTTLRDAVALFVNRPLPLENLTTATALRLVDKYAPTLLADEYDGWFRDNEELRGLLNSGHKRGGFATRCEGENNEPRLFRAFAPAALFGIGALPGTLHDRSIVITLARAKPGEIQARFDSRRTDKEKELCRRLARFTADNRERLATADPVLPEGVFNRLADNWRPLFAIAEAAGGDWPRRCAEAFAKLSSYNDADTESLRVNLLADIRQIFTGERMFSKDLVESLAQLSERPWPEVCRGKPITERWLARNLAAFGIHSKTLRIAGERAKGYEVADFNDAFGRYLPPQGILSVTA